MNVFTRIRLFFSAKVHSYMDEVEDPRQTLALGYTKQKELLRKITLGLVDVATSRRQLEAQMKKTGDRIPKLEEQARRALESGREDLARLVLQRKQTCVAEVARLEVQLAEVAEDERKLTESRTQFSQNLEQFRTRREAMSAQYTAAEAQVRIHESLSSVSNESAEIGAALERSEEKIERMKARAGALDSLLENGALNPLAGADPIERELDELAAQQAVDAELESMLAELIPEE
jgi:phage shock protein A